jgi:ribosomal protein S18 acetylase RimI-like enzyme
VNDIAPVTQQLEFGGVRSRSIRPPAPCESAAVLDIRPGVLDWTVRCATDGDLASVLGLWKAAGALPSVSDSREGLERLLATDREALLVAESAEALVGSLIAVWDGWRGSFYRLAVHPDLRRRGLASALLREGERRLRARGAVRLTAIVADAEPAAMGFWEAAGYLRQRDRTRFVSA